jgi:hypothetical protein
MTDDALRSVVVAKKAIEAHNMARSNSSILTEKSFPPFPRAHTSI